MRCAPCVSLLLIEPRYLIQQTSSAQTHFIPSCSHDHGIFGETVFQHHRFQGFQRIHLNLTNPLTS